MNKKANENSDEVQSVLRQKGITPAEQRLKELCDHTFLSLWSYANVYHDPGQELCDLLVIFQDHILIFSDKDCAFRDKGNLEVSWRRWFKDAVMKSARQTWGAEKEIKTNPHHLFLDAACTQKFPLESVMNFMVKW